MYKVHYLKDDSQLYYPNRKSTDTLSVVEVGVMSPWRNYKCDIVHGNIYLLQFVLSGEGIFNGQPFRGPCFFVVAPNDKLSYSVNSDSEPFEQCWIKLEGRRVSDFLTEARIPVETGVYPISYAKKLEQIFDELTTESNYIDTDDRYFMLQGFLKICALHLDSTSKKNSRDFMNGYTKSTLDYIHANYSQPLSERILADNLHISVNYMHRLFCQDMGITPNYYINKYRIRCAKKLLIETAYSVAQIAESVGFTSGDYFCRVFQKHVYCTPSQYRRNNKYMNESRLITNINGTKKDKKDWIYRDDTTGIMVREADIDLHMGREGIRIGLCTDLHFNYCNSQDMAEANPTLMSTFEKRKWLKDGMSLANAEACLKYISDCDQMIVMGDILDYLSYGAIELAKKHLFDKYPDVIACVGNHECCMKMQGDVEETVPFDERRARVEAMWIHDSEYYSRLIDGKVLLIQMDNASRNAFIPLQVERLRADIELAREKGYAILMFFHKPLCINNSAITQSFPIRRNDAGVVNFNSRALIGYHSEGASREGFELITNNADVIKAVFVGDMHSDYYTEISAKNADGTDAVIPQYILTGVPYDQGHVMIVNIK